MKKGSSQSVFLIGTKLWTKRLADQLALTGIFKYVRNYELDPWRAWSLIGLVKSNYLIRVGVRPGVLRPRGIFTDLVCLFAHLIGIKVVVYWIGSDVLSTYKCYREANKLWVRLCTDWSKRYIHAAGAPWLSDELKSIGINASTLYFPSPLEVPDEIPPFPENFSVLTYIPDSRNEFYGSKDIYECAKDNPNILFDVMAGEGRWVNEPLKNLRFHGWVNDVKDYYRNCVIVVRLVEHDALGATVREGWSNGRYVIYSYKLYNSIYVPIGESARLTEELKKLQYKFDAGELELNADGYKRAKNGFDATELTLKFIKTLKLH